jgi:hydroxypyruvate isomerase
MTKLSANLGLLWTELDLLDAIRAAHQAGFEAVEAYWPYITQPVDVALVLEELGLPLLVFDTVGGDLASGEFGLAALPGRQDEARSAIDKAMAYALDVSARYVHVLAGRSEPDQESTEAFLDNLRYAAQRGAEFGVGVLIEPLSRTAREGYFLHRVEQAAAAIDEIGADNVHILFDCYQVAAEGGDVVALLEEHLDRVAHIQVASVPERNEPLTGSGTLDYSGVREVLRRRGYDGFVGAEYRPTGRTEQSLDWMSDFREG